MQCYDSILQDATYIQSTIKPLKNTRQLIDIFRDLRLIIETSDDRPPYKIYLNGSKIGRMK